MVFLLVIVSVCERVCVPTRPRKGVFVSDCVCDCLCERECVFLLRRGMQSVCFGFHNRVYIPPMVLILDGNSDNGAHS